MLNLGANATNYVLGTSATATLSIADNAADLPYADVVNTSLGAEPSTNANFRFSLRRANSALPLVVNFNLSGTAQNGTDYDTVGRWQPQSSGTTQNLRAIWAANATNLWAVGDNGTILKSDGVTWTAQTSGTAIEHEYFERTLRGTFMEPAPVLQHLGLGGKQVVPGFPQLMRPCDIDGHLAYHLTTFFEKGGMVTVFAFDKAVALKEGGGWWGNVYWKVITSRDGKPLVLVAQKKQALAVAQNQFGKTSETPTPTSTPTTTPKETR